MNKKQEEKLKKYSNLLLEWNQKFNLIGKSTINDIWNRHILDCAQLINLLTEEQKENCYCADFGSGAGLPGIILSILGIKNMVLLEKSPLKCKFLQEAIKISDNKIKIINKNIFEIKNCNFDIIFSRALANLDELLTMVYPFFKKNSLCYFLKGKKVNEELEKVKNHFHFDYTLINSITSSEGKILKISNIKKIF